MTHYSYFKELKEKDPEKLMELAGMWGRNSWKNTPRRKMKKSCPICGSEFETYICISNQHVYCSAKCCNEDRKKIRAIKECRCCKKEFKVIPKRRIKYCSTICRKKRTSFAYMKKHYPEKYYKMMKKAHKKINKMQPALGKRAGNLTKELHPGLYKKIGKMGADANRKNKVGFFDLKWQRKIKKKINKMYPNLASERGKIGGPKAIITRRKNKPYHFKGVPFDSNAEREIAMNIHYQFGVDLIEGVNCHKKVGNIEIDFYIGIFIEYHPYSGLYSADGYYEKRREVLDNNGYNERELIVIA
jgi:hypothetical protein